jgi:hypothetical protein
MAGEEAKLSTEDQPSLPERPPVEGEGLIARILGEFRGSSGSGQAMLAALVAWAITVAPAAFSRVAGPYARILAVLSLVAGALGPLLRRDRPVIGRHVGISAFLAFTVFAWLGASPALQPARLDPLRQARATLPRGAVPITSSGIAAALMLIILAWHVRDGDRALAAHAIAIACAVGVITVAAAVAVDRGKRQSRGARRLTPSAVKALLVLVVIAVAGAAIMVLRGS